jgi:hypothetical protein
MRLGNTMQLFFNELNEEFCYDLEYHLDYMIKNNIKKMTLFLAEKDKNLDFFYCKEFMSVGEKGYCGKLCNAYKPRNKKNGICKHFGNTYSKTKEKIKITIKLI